MRRRIWLMFALAVMAAPLARADGAEQPFCRHGAAVGDPMMSHEGFGLSSCNARIAPRYDVLGWTIARRRASDDPMVWPADPWRSDLFGGYRRAYDDRYDRRFRLYERARIVRLEKRVHVTIETAARAPAVKRMAAALTAERPERIASTRETHLRAFAGEPAQKPCTTTGMRILHWDGQKGAALCLPGSHWRGRIVLPSPKLATKPQAPPAKP